MLDHQSAGGNWEETSLPNPLLTVIVVESIERVRQLAIVWTPAVEAAAALVVRGERLAREDTIDGRQLAVVSVHAGIEALLYASLEAQGKRVMESNRTIGLRSALGKAQGTLQEKGVLGRADALPGRPGVERLAYLRDEIVHKGLAVSRTDIAEPIASGKGFCAYVSQAMLGGDPFAD